MSQPSNRPTWHQVLAPYAQPRLGRSLFDVATSVVPYLALSVLMYLLLGVSDLLALALVVPTAGFGAHVRRVPRLHARIADRLQAR